MFANLVRPKVGALEFWLRPLKIDNSVRSAASTAFLMTKIQGSTSAQPPPVPGHPAFWPTQWPNYGCYFSKDRTGCTNSQLYHEVDLETPQTKFDSLHHYGREGIAVWSPSGRHYVCAARVTQLELSELVLQHIAKLGVLPNFRTVVCPKQS